MVAKLLWVQFDPSDFILHQCLTYQLCRALSVVVMQQQSSCWHENLEFGGFRGDKTKHVPEND